MARFVLLILALVVCNSFRVGFKNVQISTRMKLYLRNEDSSKPRSNQRPKKNDKQFPPSSKKATKEQFDKENHPFIERDIPEEDRKPLSSFKSGQKFNGKIISIVKHGFFVDIGTVKDGLVHVSDISKDYFIPNIVNKYKPGQYIDVWVKFVDARTNKIGLQMHPYTEVEQKSLTKGDIMRKSLAFYPSETSVEGTVTKVSEFGVYVDIGAAVTAFLPKRKMKLSRRQRSFKPWEIHPLNSQVKAIVHEVDKTRNRITLTTYDPVDWDEKLPNKDFIITNNDDMIEDDEELGGSTRATLSNMRSLEKTLALSLDDDDDELFESEGEELSADEINALTGGKRKAQLLIDELYSPENTEISSKNNENINGNNNNNSDNSQKMMVTSIDEMIGEEMSTDELFDELAQGRSYLTIKEIKKWDYLKEFLDNKEIEENRIKEIINECGGQGKLNIEQFDDFIDLIVDELGLIEIGDEDEDDVDYDDEDDEDDDIEELRSTRNTKGSKGKKEEYILLDDFSESDSRPPTVSTTTTTSTTATTSTKNAKSQNDKKTEVKTVSSTSNTINSNKDFQGDISDIYSIDTDDEDDIDDIVVLSSKNKDDEVYKGFDNNNSKTSKESKKLSQDKSLDELYNDKSDTTDLLQYVYQQVAGKKGYVTIEDVLAWDFSIALIQQNGISEAQIKQIYSSICTKKDGKADRKTFEKILDKLSEVDIMSPPTVGSTLGSTSVKSNTSTGTGDMVLPKGTAVVKSTTEQKNEIPIVADNVSPMKSAVMDVNGELFLSDEEIDENIFLEGLDDTIDDDDDEYAELSIDDAFDQLADGKEYIQFEALSQWNVITELLEDDVITTKKLKELFNQAGAKKGKLDFEGFNELIDLLMPYAEFQEEDGDDDAYDGSDFDIDLSDYENDDSQLNHEEFDEITLDDLTDSFSSLSTTTSSSSSSVSGENEEKEKKALLKETPSNKDKDTKSHTTTSTTASGKKSTQKVLQIAENNNNDYDDEDDDYNEQDCVTVLMDDTLSKSTSTTKSSKDSKDAKSATTTTTTTNTVNDKKSDNIDSSTTKNTAAVASISTTGGEPYKLATEDELDAMDDETVLKNVFQGLAGVKKHVSLKDMLNWDFVLDLMGEGALDEEMLLEMMNEAGGTKKGVDIEAFDKLVDQLVDLYGEISDEDDDEDNDSYDDNDDVAVDSTLSDVISSDLDMKMNLQKDTIQDDFDSDDDDDDEEEVLDIDIGASFDALSKGKGYVTFKSFLKWDLISNLLDDEYIQLSDIDTIITELNIKNKDKLDVVAFEDLVSEIVSRVSDDDDDDDDDGDSDIYMDDDEDDDDEDPFSDDDDIIDMDTDQLTFDLKQLIDSEEGRGGGGGGGGGGSSSSSSSGTSSKKQDNSNYNNKNNNNKNNKKK